MGIGDYLGVASAIGTKLKKKPTDTPDDAAAQEAMNYPTMGANGIGGAMVAKQYSDDQAAADKTLAGTLTGKSIANTANSAANTANSFSKGNIAGGIGGAYRTVASGALVPTAAALDTAGAAIGGVAGVGKAIGQGLYDAGSRFASGLSGQDPNAPTPVASPTQAEMSAYKASQSIAAPKTTPEMATAAVKSAQEIAMNSPMSQPSARPNLSASTTLQAPANSVPLPSYPGDELAQPGASSLNGQVASIARGLPQQQSTLDPKTQQFVDRYPASGAPQPTQGQAVSQYGAFNSAGQPIAMARPNTDYSGNPNIRVGSDPAGDAMRERAMSIGSGFSVLPSQAARPQFREINGDQDFMTIAANRAYNNNLRHQQTLDASIANNNATHEIGRFNAVTGALSEKNREEMAPLEREYKRAETERAKRQAEAASAGIATKGDMADQKKQLLESKQAEFLSRERDRAHKESADKGEITRPSADEILRSKTDKELAAYGVQRPAAPPQVPSTASETMKAAVKDNPQQRDQIAKIFRDHYHVDPAPYLK